MRGKYYERKSNYLQRIFIDQLAYMMISIEQYIKKKSLNIPVLKFNAKFF